MNWLQLYCIVFCGKMVTFFFVGGKIEIINSIVIDPVQGHGIKADIFFLFMPILLVFDKFYFHNAWLSLWYLGGI